MSQNENTLSKKIEKDVNDAFKLLDNDIKLIDNQYSALCKYILDLDTQLNNLKNLIRLESDPTKKGKLFTVLNTSLEIMAKYQELLVKHFGTKFNYRKEQNDTVFRKIKLLEIELKKANEEEKDFSTGSLFKLMNEMNELISSKQAAIASHSESSGTDPASNEIEELSFLKDLEDPKYKI